MIPRPSIEGFWIDGEWRELVNPGGPPTWRQLVKLNAAGRLELVRPGTAEPITKGECAAALDEVTT
jgi:hypothetical protein